jgi:molybdopterin-biosynthesis enzyme MoeA-like protein
MKVGVYVIGDEILSGKRQDAHLERVIEILKARGLFLSWAHFEADDRARLTAAFRRSMASDTVVFSFGGIGATPDDLTRPCAAAALGVGTRPHPEGLAILEKKWGRDFSPERRRLVEFPQGARLIPNPVNQVPGFSCGDHHFVPGFPKMAWPMVEWCLDTYYADHFHQQALIERRFLLHDLPESRLIPLMEQLLNASDGLRVSSLPSTEVAGQVELGLRGDPEQVGLAAQTAVAWLRDQAIRFDPLDDFF